MRHTLKFRFRRRSGDGWGVILLEEKKVRGEYLFTP